MKFHTRSGKVTHGSLH